MDFQIINTINSHMMKVSSLLFTIFLFCASLNIHAQVQSTGLLKFSLHEASEYALKNSPVLLNSARDVEIAKKQVWENTATGLPQANLNSGYSYSPKLAGISELFTGAGGDSAGSGGSPFPF